MMHSNTNPQTSEYQTVSNLLKIHYGILPKTIKKLPGELDLNFFIKTITEDTFILKISHMGENPDYLDMQTQAMRHLADHTLDLALPKIIEAKSGQYLLEIEYKGERRLMRMLTWIEGRLWANVKPHSPSLIQSLGKACGYLSKSLQSFNHPAAHRWIKWDVAQTAWVEKHLDIFEQKKEKEIAKFFWNLFKGIIPILSQLRKSINHNDANDYNTLVSPEKGDGAKVISVIDFGDMVFTQTISELAIAGAYALMHKPDPLSVAVDLVKGYHKIFSLQEKELEVLWTLIGSRLLISVTASALNKKTHPDNEYLQISERPAWDLLEKMYAIPPSLAHYSFRQTCGYEACPKRLVFSKWLLEKSPKCGKLVDYELISGGKHFLDLSVKSLELGNNHEYDTAERMHRKISRILDDAGVQLGIGKYNEVRPLYSTDSYLLAGNEGPQWRTVHMGLDIFLPAGTAVYAPLAGKVHSFQNNDAERDYGPTIILEHYINEELTFYSLYGHLSLESLKDLKVGQPIEKGQQIATFGGMDVNGAWSPHLHFQIMLDMLDMEGDFPGVAFPHQREVMKSICPDPNLLIGMEDDEQDEATLEVDEILARRRQSLGKSLSVSYKEPLKMHRAYMQYLYADDGRRYLDTVNNVPHVGHQHPRVVRAAQQQIAVLNTNTRYLHEQIVHFAEELLDTLPQELSVVHFVNSGSEANELALRMARTYTAQKDMVVVEVGYHGNTNACIDISSYKFDSKGGSGSANYIHKVPIPDTYRGIYRNGESDVGKKYAAHIQETIQKVKSKGKGIAGFICESILSCGGQIVLPPNYLREAFHHVRSAGGVCIMDEVQVGFGRVGDTFWGFELQGVVPDIVTMGKPIGNGHPLGAVVCTREIADSFANGMEYFNTFGGNPVSCTIGREVLKIVREENLQQHAREVGSYLTKGLRELSQKYPIIGDVRGPGLFLGFELVKNRETLIPAAAEATYLANRMRIHGILMSTDGPLHNVLKIKPPMAFNRKNADFLMETLDKVLTEDYLM